MANIFPFYLGSRTFFTRRHAIHAEKAFLVGEGLGAHRSQPMTSHAAHTRSLGLQYCVTLVYIVSVHRVPIRTPPRYRFAPPGADLGLVSGFDFIDLNLDGLSRYANRSRDEQASCVLPMLYVGISPARTPLTSTSAAIGHAL